MLLSQRFLYSVSTFLILAAASPASAKLKDKHPLSL
jgi:hypothetical protein